MSSSRCSTFHSHRGSSIVSSWAIRASSMASPPSGKADPLAGQVAELESLISCVTPRAGPGPVNGFCEVHVNTTEGVWSLLRSWLRPHRGVSREKLPLYLGFFEFVHNARCRGRALLGELVAALVA